MDDLISRNALLAEYDRQHKGEAGKARTLIANAPAVDAVEVKYGRWKGAGMGDYRCSLCWEVVSGNNHNFCPNCGADMSERKEE